MAPPDTSGSCYRTRPRETWPPERLVRVRPRRDPRGVPLKPRDRSPGIHHVWVKATSHWDYYIDDTDRISWIRWFVKVCARREWRVLAFCQMTTHVHGLVAIDDDSLPVGMEYLNREYSREFNARHERAGHLVSRRYGSRRTKGSNDLLGTYGYVVLHPVRAGICTRAEDWRWSSYASTAGLTADFPFVDAALVVAEAGGTVDRLRSVIDGRAAEIVRSRHVR